SSAAEATVMVSILVIGAERTRRDCGQIAVWAIQPICEQSRGGKSAEELGGVVVAALRHQLQLAYRLDQRHPPDLLPAERHHHPELPGMRRVGGVDPEP